MPHHMMDKIMLSQAKEKIIQIILFAFELSNPKQKTKQMRK